jgi:hypothetical protein
MADADTPPAGWQQATTRSAELLEATAMPASAVRLERRRAGRAAKPQAAAAAAATAPAPLDCSAVRLRGEVVTPGHMRYANPDPAKPGQSQRAWLVVRIMLSGGTFAAASLDMGTTPEAHTAGEQRARRLRRGMQCELYGSGLLVQHQHGEPVLQVLHAQIFPVASPIPTEPGSGPDTEPQG